MSSPPVSEHHCEPDSARADRLAYFLLKAVNRAVYKHALIVRDDRILVATSGGKDSLTLLDLLHRRRRWAPEPYHLIAGHVRSDYHCGRAVPEEWLASWCVERGIAFEQTPMAVADEVADLDKGRCYRCGRARRKALFTMAERLGCSKVAMGHHADDAAETTLMNLFFSGQVRGLEAAQPLFQGQLIVIRPLAYVEERDIVTYARAAGYPIEGEPCPDGLASRRNLVRQMLRALESTSPGTKRRIHGAVSRHSEAQPRDGDSQEGPRHATTGG